MEENLITKVAIPRLGCGHEGMDWEKVKEIIEEVFEDTDVEILICSLMKDEPEKKDNDDYDDWGDLL